jgi:hypothetical protein
MRFFKGGFFSGFLPILCLVFFLCPQTLWAGKPEVGYAEGRLSVKAERSSLFSVLEAISTSTQIDIFVSTDLPPKDVTIEIVDLPLEDALKRVLRGVNYAAIYGKEGESWYIAALKLYPKGKYGGDVIPLYPKEAKAESRIPEETKTVVISGGEEIATFGALEERGRLVPSRTVLKGEGSSVRETGWFALKMQLERKEAEEYQRLQRERMRMEAAKDPERKQALAMAYADQLQKFQEMKAAHLSKIEAMKRIERFREMTR